MTVIQDTHRSLPFLTSDLWGGLAAMLVALASAIAAFCVLVYIPIPC